MYILVQVVPRTIDDDNPMLVPHGKVFGDDEREYAIESAKDRAVNGWSYMVMHVEAGREVVMVNPGGAPVASPTTIGALLAGRG